MYQILKRGMMHNHGLMMIFLQESNGLRSTLNLTLNNHKTTHRKTNKVNLE